MKHYDGIANEIAISIVLVRRPIILEGPELGFLRCLDYAMALSHLQSKMWIEVHGCYPSKSIELCTINRFSAKKKKGFSLKTCRPNCCKKR